MAEYKGFDISVWQPANFDFAKAKASGYNFAIIRAGGTGYGGDGTSKFVDGNFYKYYQNAKASGINVGAYYYSCANTSEKGRAEAEYLYNNCLKGRQFEYPIFIDVENRQWQLNNKKGVTDAIVSFCDYLEKLGYFVGVYASYDFFKNHIDNARIDKYLRWLAVWSDKQPIVDFKYRLWQYTNRLNINGVTVDGDISFNDYASIIKEGGFNGFKKEEPTPPTPPAPKELILKVGDSFKVKSIENDNITIEKIKEEK